MREGRRGRERRGREEGEMRVKRKGWRGEGCGELGRGGVGRKGKVERRGRVGEGEVGGRRGEKSEGRRGERGRGEERESGRGSGEKRDGRRWKGGEGRNNLNLKIESPTSPKKIR